ncbi:TatD family hydrolase [Pedobacter sp. GR22-6]|uniref:TatD family hydrolase n=1 Tax=Pedobacter sp. GR22-6 TaxID=3127957 RepID=UPI00307EE45F
MDYLDIHTHNEQRLPGVRAILSLSLTGDEVPEYPERDLALGLHPWFAKPQQLNSDYARLREAAKLPQVKMIGECGLDRFKGPSLPEQTLILRKQFELADELQKPVILHCVRCFDELIALRKEMKLEIPMVLHGFNKKKELGRQMQSLGFYLSFGKALLDADSGAAALAREGDVFFLESDHDEHRIEEIYEAAANLKNCSVEELKALIFANWNQIIR